MAGWEGARLLACLHLFQPWVTRNSLNCRWVRRTGKRQAARWGKNAAPCVRLLQTTNQHLDRRASGAHLDAVDIESRAYKLLNSLLNMRALASRWHALGAGAHIALPPPPTGKKQPPSKEGQH